MQKTGLIALLTERLALRPAEADAVVSAFIEQITNALSRGESVQLTGFGSFQVREREARTGRNPATGEALTIAASRAVVFRPGKELRNAVAGPEATSTAV